MILTGPKIKEEVKNKNITIDPFCENLVNPNSYNYRLDKTILVPSNEIINPKSPLQYTTVEIPKEGYLLEPNKFYLANTVETIGSDVYTTILIGRSSIGRLGLFLQITADLGHIGTSHKWTLELHVVQPLIVYYNMKIGQVSFWKNYGDVDLYSGEYKQHSTPKISKLYNEL